MSWQGIGCQLPWREFSPRIKPWGGGQKGVFCSVGEQSDDSALCSRCLLAAFAGQNQRFFSLEQNPRPLLPAKKEKVKKYCYSERNSFQ